MDSKSKTTALPSAVAVGEVVVNRPPSKIQRALAVENPQAFPEVSAAQQLLDLEDPEVYDED